jgi:spore germination protein KA
VKWLPESFIKDKLKSLLLFKEPEPAENFVLKENELDNSDKKERPYSSEEMKEEIGLEKSQPQKRRKNEDLLLKNQDAQKSPECKEKKSREESEKEQETEISSCLYDNLQYMKDVYSIPTNGDIIIREFKFAYKDKAVDAFIIFFDGMVDRSIVNTNILNPLMLLSNLDIKEAENNVEDFVKNRLVAHNQLVITGKYADVIKEVNFGGVGLFVEGMPHAATADVKGWVNRGVNRPLNEEVIRGPQEGFTEILRFNTALIRKSMKDEDLIAENITIGRRSKTPCSLLYVKDIANNSLVGEVRRRLKSIKVDYLLDSGELEQLIEDSSFLPAPLILATERPDRVATFLAEGRVAVIVHGSPYVLVMPIVHVDLIKSAEDVYIRYPYATLLRIIRIIGVILALLLPGLYVAITNFHHEMIPTDLIFAITASRERVPFPSIVEILIMEVSFELIREAGIRIPGTIGFTLGIIGALILGQAAVAANIVSPILIIIVAVTGIGSFAIPDFSLGYAFRALRFVFIFLGALSGFLGITTGVFIVGLAFCAAKSFGVPYMAPFGPRTSGGMQDEFMRAPMWKQEKRADYVNPKDLWRQPKISRRWIIQKPGKGDNGGK